MKSVTKEKILKSVSRIEKAVNKTAVSVGASAMTLGTMAMTAFAEGEPSGGSLSSAMSNIDTSLVLDAFYQVLPIGLTIALPIVGAKVGLNFFFGLVKGA